MPTRTGTASWLLLIDDRRWSRQLCRSASARSKPSMSACRVGDAIDNRLAASPRPASPRSPKFWRGPSAAGGAHKLRRRCLKCFAVSWTMEAQLPGSRWGYTSEITSCSTSSAPSSPSMAAHESRVSGCDLPRSSGRPDLPHICDAGHRRVFTIFE